MSSWIGYFATHDTVSILKASHVCDMWFLHV